VSVQPAAEDDAGLLRLAAAGDPNAFEQLVTKHEASVYRFVRTLTADVPRAEDALQETFLAAWRAAATFRHGSSVRTWLFAIARHAVERQFRRRVGEPAPEDQVSIEALGIEAGWGSPGNPEDVVLRQEQADIVARALDALGPDDRRVLVLRDLEGLDGDEAAQVLGVSLAAVKSRLHRARLRFAARLREEAAGGR
jgi:RNA polymerase sigma-70 factor (ECF subfamily)